MLFYTSVTEWLVQLKLRIREVLDSIPDHVTGYADIFLAFPQSFIANAGKVLISVSTTSFKISPNFPFATHPEIRLHILSLPKGM
jgi:hypothetical protein